MPPDARSPSRAGLVDGERPLVRGRSSGGPRLRSGAKVALISGVASERDDAPLCLRRFNLEIHLDTVCGSHLDSAPQSAPGERQTGPSDLRSRHTAQDRPDSPWTCRHPPYQKTLRGHTERHVPVQRKTGRR